MAIRAHFARLAVSTLAWLTIQTVLPGLSNLTCRR